MKYKLFFSFSICAVWNILIKQWSIFCWDKKIQLSGYFYSGTGVLLFYTNFHWQSHQGLFPSSPNKKTKTKQQTLLRCLLEYLVTFHYQAETGNVFVPEKKRVSLLVCFPLLSYTGDSGVTGNNNLWISPIHLFLSRGWPGSSVAACWLVKGQQI